MRLAHSPGHVILNRSAAEVKNLVRTGENKILPFGQPLPRPAWRSQDGLAVGPGDDMLSICCLAANGGSP
jgi:hypothetical protein